MEEQLWLYRLLIELWTEELVLEGVLSGPQLLLVFGPESHLRLGRVLLLYFAFETGWTPLEVSF